MSPKIQAGLFLVALSAGTFALGWSLSIPKPEPVQSLQIISQPTQAEVVLNGQPQGKTPLLLTPPAGTYKLEVRKSGFEDLSLSLEVKPGQSRSCFPRLNPKLATLTLEDTRGGEIQLGPGVPQKLTGKGPWKLKPGRYEVMARKGPLLSEPQQFEIKPEQKLQLSLSWPSLPAGLPGQAIGPKPPAPPPTPPSNPSQPAQPDQPVRPYQPPSPYQPVYRPPVRPYQPPPRYTPPSAPEPLFTPIPPSQPEPPSYTPEEPLFTPLP